MPIETMTDHTIWLTIAVFLPLVGVLALIFIDRRDEQTIKAVGIATAAATFLASLYVLARFDFDNAERLQFFADHEWIEFIRANYTIGLDGISLPLFVLSSFITLRGADLHVGQHARGRATRRPSSSSTLVLQVGMAGTFVAQDLILFFVFFEVVLLPMYFMIGVWGGENRMYASLKFFLFTMFGSALMLVAFLALFFQTDAESFSFLYLNERRSGHRDRPHDADLDLRRDVRRLRRQGADVPVPHVASRCPHRGADARLGDPRRHPAEARHLRLRAHRHPVPARGRQGVGAGDRHPRRHRDHLRGAVLSRPDRSQTPRRLLVGRPHGLRHARHLDAHDVRHQRRPVRDGRPRVDHRDAVLHRRVDQAPLPHADDQAVLGDAHLDAPARLDPRLLRDGQPRPARARRILG